MVRLRLLVFLIVLVSCSQEDEPPFVPLAPPENGVQDVMEAKIRAGEERFLCKWVQLPTSRSVITRVQSQYTRGSHHLALAPLPGQVP